MRLPLVIVGWLAYGTALPHSPALVAAAFLLGALAFLAIGFLLIGLARRGDAMWKALVAPAALAAVFLVAVASAGGAAETSEPPAVQVARTAAEPREGRLFVGLSVAILEEGARLYRSVRVSCTAGKIRLGPGRTRVLPVQVYRFARTEGPSPVRSMTTCAWYVPAGVRGRTLVTQVIDSRVNSDGTANLETETFTWKVR